MDSSTWEFLQKGGTALVELPFFFEPQVVIFEGQAVS